MSDQKRKIMDAWACPVCLDTIGEGCVPAVMNGCTPFAHVACTKCLTALRAQNAALCPKCRAPFTTFRPLADFVDTDDAEVAAELKKRQKSDSLADKIEALQIDDPLLKERVEWCAKQFATRLRDNPEWALQRTITWTTHIPEFDKKRAALTLVEARRNGMSRCKTRLSLVSRLHALTETVLPLLRILYPQFEFRSAHGMGHGYFSISSNPRS